MSLPQPPPRPAPISVKMGEHLVFAQIWSGWLRAIWKILGGTTYTGTIPLAKLTGGGANGSITVSQGIIHSVVLPT